MEQTTTYNRPIGFIGGADPEYIFKIANATMPAAKGSNNLIKEDYDTEDIIELIKFAHQDGLSDTKKLALSLPKGKDTIEFLKSVYDLVKLNIKYKIDPIGDQWVRNPARLWADKEGDCKSFSIFIGTILQNKGIPFMYRFVSFQPGNKMVTHVYIIVPCKNGKYITMDAVYKGFNLEKSFNYKIDLAMSGLSHLSGVDNKIIDFGNKDISELTEAEFDLMIAKDRAKSYQEHAARLKGIGSLIAQKYQDTIDMLDDGLEVLNKHSVGAITDDEMEAHLGYIADDAVLGGYSMAPSVFGIGDLGAIERKRNAAAHTRKNRRAVKVNKFIKKTGVVTSPFSISGNKKTGKFLKKVAAKAKKVVKKAGTVAKKVVKTAVKVVTAPARLAAKGILEITLPKAAPFFLYLFITDKAILAKLPAQVKRKREKAEKVANFIVNGIGMKRTHFMGIVRNGIIKEYGKEPEKVLSEQMKGIAGIGVLPVVAIGPIIEIIKKISTFFKGKAEAVSKEDAPDASDWGNMTPAEKTQAVEAAKELENTDDDKKAGGSFWNSLG